MYIRFVIARKDEYSGRRLGIFHAARDLCESGVANKYDEAQLESIRDWFNSNLEKPTSFTRSRKPHTKGIAIGWFKDSAKQHLSRMYQFTSILEENGCRVEVIRTSRPGYIVYEDEYQATAVPYADTTT